MRKESFKVNGDQLVATLKSVISKGQASRIVVKSESGKVILNIPVTMGVVALLWAPFFTGLSTGVALLSKFTIDIEKKDEN